MTRARSLALAAVAIAVAAANGACSSGEPQESVEPEFAWLLDRDIQDARAGGANDEQLAILEQARETGEVTFEAYDEAVDRALRCMREAGVQVIDDGIVDHLGYRIRSYSVSAEGEEADPREPLPGVSVHRCIAEHSFWVEMTYDLQPASIEAQDVYFDQFRGAIVACLTAHGVEVDPDATRDEIWRTETEATQAGRLDVDCTAESGYGAPVE